MSSTAAGLFAFMTCPFSGGRAARADQPYDPASLNVADKEECVQRVMGLREGDRVTFGYERNIRRLPFERVVSHTYPIDQISEAFRQADWLSHGGDSLRISRAAIAC